MNSKDKKELYGVVSDLRNVKAHEDAAKQARWNNNKLDEQYHEGYRIALLESAAMLERSLQLLEEKKL
jgi:hypothetical protein